MKKIAIITITNSGLNFGNRLQNYALQKTLESLSATVETIYSSKSIFNSIIFSRMRRIAKIILRSDKRRRSFNKFDRKHINKSAITRYECLNDYVFNSEYDAFVAGSDQIWNPHFHFNSDFEFMTFADKNKRFSYAASFGVSQIPKEYESSYKNMLSDISSVSVREEQGAAIVNELTGRDVPIHIDPALLLDKEDYMPLIEKPDMKTPEKYILTYFLGIVSAEQKAFVNQISQELKLPIVELSDSRNSPFYGLGPSHFLYLINHSEYICTDSFHGAVFSILFKKKFTVCYREKAIGEEKMHSRIDTLLSKLHLEERIL